LARKRSALLRVRCAQGIPNPWAPAAATLARRIASALPLDERENRRFGFSPNRLRGGRGIVMKVALVNPPWHFENSIYFGCRAPHLPLELGYSKQLLEAAGHEVLILDGHLCAQSSVELASSVAAFNPDLTVVTTAPSYLFWRCAPPELRVPMEFLLALAGRGGTSVAVGPHSSATPATALRKLGVDIVVLGECEEILAELADA